MLILTIEPKKENPDEKNTKYVEMLMVPNAPLDKTFLVVTTFTEADNTIRIFFDSLLTSSATQKGSIRVSRFSENNIRKICLSNAGLVTYRSRLLKDKDNVASD